MATSSHCKETVKAFLCPNYTQGSRNLVHPQEEKNTLCHKYFKILVHPSQLISWAFIYFVDHD